MEPKPVEPPDKGTGGRRKAILVGLAVLVAGAAVIMFLLLRGLGDPTRQGGIVIDNRTRGVVTIYSLTSEGVEQAHAEIGARSVEESGIPCTAGLLIARDPEGRLLDRRPPDTSCSTWVIQS